MSSRSPYPEADEDTDGRRIPRWVWMSGVVVAAIVLLIVVVMLLGGGHPRPDHGPGGDETPPTDHLEQIPDDHMPPEGGH